MRANVWMGLAFAAVGCQAPTAGVFPPPRPPRPLVAEGPRDVTDRAAPSPGTLVERTLDAVARRRGLPPLHGVPCVRVSRGELVALVKEHVARDVPRDAIRAEGLAQKLLGFFPADGDYEAVTYALLEGEMAGFYEPRNGTMYLARDLDEATAEETLAHELEHALQDQYWDLGTRSAYVAGQNDANDAFSALAEGDATSVTVDLAESRKHAGATALDVPDPVLTARWLDIEASGSGSDVPRALQRALVAPYIDGTLFVQARRRAGGWAEVNAAWDHPPETTEQLLHASKWHAHEPAISLPDPGPPPKSAGFHRLEATTYGEQSLALTFEEWMPRDLARQAASGWGGDRTGLFTRGDREAALVWHIRFDDAAPLESDAYAERAFVALASAVPRLGHAVTVAPSFLCVDRAHNGVLAVLRHGRDLLMGFGAVSAEAGGFRSTMSCAEARRWVDATVQLPDAERR